MNLNNISPKAKTIYKIYKISLVEDKQEKKEKSIEISWAVGEQDIKFRDPNSEIKNYA